MSKYFLHTYGGLGDHLTGYLFPQGRLFGFGFLKQLKEEEPNSIVRLSTHASQDIAPELFRYDPNINEIIQNSWKEGIGRCDKSEVKGYIFLEEYGKKKRWKKRPNKKIYTSPKEDIEIKKITSQGDYIAIHPFSTEQGRMLFDLSNLHLLIKDIIKEFDKNVIILGNSYTRVRNPNNPNGKKEIQEKFSKNIPRVINLISKTNPRVSVNIAHQANLLLGTNSAFWCFAKGGSVPFIGLSQNKHSHEAIRKKFTRPEIVEILTRQKTTKETYKEILKAIERKLKK